MAGSPTALTKLAIGTTDPVDTGISFVDFDPGVSIELRDTTGTRGSFFSDGIRIIPNKYGVEPRLSCEPSTTELLYLLAWVMSGTPTGTTTKTFPWSDTASVRNIHFKPKVGEEWFLGDVGVDNATFRSSTGEPLTLELDLLGRTFDAERTNFPAITYDTTTQPWIMSNLALVVGGVTRQCREFSFTVRNGLDRSRFLNSLTLTAVQKLAGGFSVSIEVPSGDNGSQFWAAGVTVESLVATYTNPTTDAVFTITIADVRLAPRSPVHSAGSEGFLRLEGACVRVGTNDPVTITVTP